MPRRRVDVPDRIESLGRAPIDRFDWKTVLLTWCARTCAPACKQTQRVRSIPRSISIGIDALEPPDRTRVSFGRGGIIARYIPPSLSLSLSLSRLGGLGLGIHCRGAGTRG